MNETEWGYVLQVLTWGTGAAGAAAYLHGWLVLGDTRRGMKHLDAIFCVSYAARALIHTFAVPDSHSAIVYTATAAVFGVLWWITGGSDDWKKRKRKLLDGARVVVRNARLAVARPAGRAGVIP